MAGSRAWFEYVSDNGNTYAVQIDESNALAVGFTPLASTATPKKPAGLEMRHANLVHAASGAKRVVPVPTVGNDLWTETTTSLTLYRYDPPLAVAETFTVQSLIGERRTRRQNTADTGLQA